MVAIFSQFINPNITNSDRFILAAMAGVIDTTWYVLVAAVLAGTPIVDKLRVNAVIVDRLFGVALLVISILLIMRTLAL